jgi:hypothetical protein
MPLLVWATVAPLACACGTTIEVAIPTAANIAIVAIIIVADLMCLLHDKLKIKDF